MGDFPDSPEAVALRLFEIILERGEGDAEPRRNRRRDCREMLDLFAECLTVTHSKRAVPATMH